MLLQILILASIVWYFVYRWKNRAMYKLANQLHNSSVGISLPLIGQSYLFRGDAEDRMIALKKLGRLSTEKGGVLAVWQSHKLFIYVTDAEVLDFLTKTCLEKDLMEYLTIFFGNGSLFTPVQNWRPRRKATSPIFNQRNLRHFSLVFTYQSEVLAERLRSAADKGAFPLWSYMTAYALDSVCESTLGVSVDAQSGGDHPFPKAFHKLSESVSDLIFQPHLHNRAMFRLYCYLTGALKNSKVICDFVDTVIKEKRKGENGNELINQNTQKEHMRSRMEVPTFMELFMESTGAGRKLTEVELREEAVVLVMAASDTSAVGASFTALMLARHPEIQDKVYQEIQEVLGNTIRSVTADDLPKLKYLEAVIKETMRLYPPVPMVLRQVTTDVTIPTGVTLLKGCTVLVDIEAVHRNRKYWGEDADSFKPERFLDTALPHPAAYIPFSFGPRNCVGYRYAMMSMKTVLTTLLQRYRFLPADIHKSPLGSDSPHDEATNPLRVYHGVMMKELYQFTLQLETRQ